MFYLKINIKLIYCYLFGFFFVACGKSKLDDSEKPKVTETKVSYYTNPVFEPILADPSIVRDPTTGYFYGYGTEDDWGDGNGNRLMPIIRSSDLVNWTSVGNAFSIKPSWKSNGGIWAADVVYIDKKFYLYYSLSIWADPNPGIGLAISATPTGPFTDLGKLFTTQEIGVPNSIDPFLFEEDNVKYLFWGSYSNTSTQGTYGIVLSADGRSIPDLTKKFKIAAGDFEAVMIHKRDGYYYFFGSKGNCCQGANTGYNVQIARSANLKGPYLDKNGADIKQRGKGTPFLYGNEVFVGPGHNARIITDEEGTDWFIYHGIDKAQGLVSSGATRRSLMLDKVLWKDGWPEIKGNTPSVSKQKGPVFGKFKP